jgi:DNA-binding LacI/PurR family transcriptional regulator
MINDNRVTGHQLAAMLGLSQPTVSRALRGHKKVNEQTRLRVLELAKELNYSVDHNALRLRTRQSYTIALVLLCRPGENRANINPFYLSLLGCIAASAADHGYNLIVSFQDNEDNFFANYTGSGQADGLIVIGSGQNVGGWSFFGQQVRHGAPMLCWGASKEDLMSIKSDNPQGVRLAISHLQAKGCRSIAFIGPTDSEQPSFQDRMATYLQVMTEQGLPVICPPLPENAVREDQGYEATASLLRDKVQFDGLFAANDFIALGAMRALADHGVKVGEQVRVVGFDGIATGAYSQPPLTTIEQDYRMAGEMLVNALIAVMKGETPDLSPVPVQLLERASA